MQQRLQQQQQQAMHQARSLMGNGITRPDGSPRIYGQRMGTDGLTYGHDARGNPYYTRGMGSPWLPL